MHTKSHTLPIGPNRAFFTFVLLLAGWGVLASSLISVGAGLLAHVIASLASACVLMVVLRRRRYTRSLAGKPSRVRQAREFCLASSDAGRAAVLFVLGYALGALIVATWAFPIVATGLALLVVPWIRPSFYDEHFLMACVAFLVGALLATAPSILHTPPILRFVAAWGLWACALIGLFLPTRHPSADAVAVPSRSERAREHG